MTITEIDELVYASGRMDRALHLLNSAREAIRFPVPELCYEHLAGCEDDIDAAVKKVAGAAGCLDRAIEKFAGEEAA